jgi:hypothetical protein
MQKVTIEFESDVADIAGIEGRIFPNELESAMRSFVSKCTISNNREHFHEAIDKAINYHSRIM